MSPIVVNPGDGVSASPPMPDAGTLRTMTGLGSTTTAHAKAAERLSKVIADIGPMVVAYSGGVDSSLLAVAAYRQLGADMVAVTARSASLAAGELEQCQALAEHHGVPWQAVDTDEISNERYRANDGDRCFWCKSALMDQLVPLAEARNATVTLGVNLNDLGDHRPGQQAAAERGARFPLVEADFDKSTIRELAKSWGLSVWDRPAMPCLSSRVPYGTPVTVPLLTRVDRAESALRTLGFDDVRVRHYGDVARIELPLADLSRAVEMSAEITSKVLAAGYRYATLDLAGLNSGNLNHALSDQQRQLPTRNDEAADGS